MLREQVILEKIKKLSERTNLPEFEEMKMSDAFLLKTQIEDEYGIEEEDEKRRPFEDCPMPILKCAVCTRSEKIEMKMLIDSGSSLDLISGAMARKLQRFRCTTKPMKKNVRVKVANGKRSVIKDAMAPKLQFGPQTSEETDFLILKIRPYRKKKKR